MQDNQQITQVIFQWIETFTHRFLRDRSRYIRSTGLTMPQFGILIYVLHCEKCTVSEISERMGISNPAASQLVDRLVLNGLLTRSEDPRDRRARQIQLTEQGHLLIKNSQQDRFRWVENLIDSLPEEDRAAVQKAIPALVEATRRLENDEEKKEKE